jgi:hypothetical protein
LAYYRIKPRWYGRATGLKTPPATEALRLITADWVLGNIDIFELDFPFVEYIRRLNTTEGNSKPWRLISAPNAGIFNYTRKPDGSIDLDWYGDGRKPFLNTVSFDGNVVNVTDTQEGYAMVESIDVNKYVPLYTYLERPDLVHQFTTVNNQGRLFKAGSGVTIYVPLLTRFQSALTMDQLEPFPDLPIFVTVTWPSGLNLRKSPGITSEKLNVFPQGRQLLVNEYFPRGAEVWGKMNGGYICLYTPTVQNPYSTTWKMVTSPPPP